MFKNQALGKQKLYTMKKRVIFVLIIMFALSKSVIAQNISGLVVDSKDVPLEGVTVQVKGTPNKATVTDLNGKFVLSNVANAAQKTLTFSFLGYEKLEQKVSSLTNLKIVLQESSKGLEEIVVVGYGSQKKESVTAAIASVGTKELVQSPTANISNQLAGRLPGLISMQTSGRPGKDESTLYIRGLGTYNDGTQNPLIMVDGVARDSYDNIDPNEVESISILKDASATAVFGVRGANGVILITTKRGKVSAPKVSLSTSMAQTSFSNMPGFLGSYDYATKKNEGSELAFWKKNASKFDGTTGKTWTDFEAYKNEELSSGLLRWQAEGDYFYSNTALLKYKNAHNPSSEYYDPYFYPDVDWVKAIFKDHCYQSQTNMNINGGTEDMKYFISLGYLDQGGLFRTDFTTYPKDMEYTNKRYNIRGNFDFNITKDFTAAVDLGYQHQIEGGLDNGNESWLWEKRIMWSNPLSTVGMIDGKFVMPDNNTNFEQNIYSEMAGMGYSTVTESTMTSSIKLKYDLRKLIPGLSVNGRVAYDSFYRTTTGGSTPVIKYKITANPNGDVSDPIFTQMSEESTPNRYSDWYSYKWRKIYGEGSLSYNRSFGKHDVGALALYNAEKKYDPNLSPDLPHAYIGMVGRVTYGYDSKYLAEFNAGYNGSENFPVGQRFGFLPAFSAGWVASNESFFPTNDYVTYLKIRGSIGKVGNDNVTVNNVTKRYLYSPDVWTYTGSYSFGSLAEKTSYSGAQEGTVGNPNVTWETALKSNLGFEGKFFNDKLSVTYDYFNEDRTDILSYKGSVPTIVQATLPPYNLGEVKNWGYEVDATWRDKIGKVNYFVKGNLSHNKNKIIEMDEAISKGLEYQAQTGSPVYSLSLLKSDGFYNSWAELYELDADGNPILSSPVLALDAKGKSYNNAAGNPVYVKDLGVSGAVLQPGDIKIVDYNYDGVVDAKDYRRAGKTKIPEYTFGFSFGADYKGFDASFLFQGVTGVARYCSYSPFSMLRAMTSLANYTWSAERYANGERIEYPYAGGAAPYCDFFNKDASYIRLKNMEIGYRIQPSFLTKLGIESTRIYLNGTNLITWSKNSLWGDPENLGTLGYPLVKTFNLGINVNF